MVYYTILLVGSSTKTKTFRYFPSLKKIKSVCELFYIFCRFQSHFRYCSKIRHSSATRAYLKVLK
jgi:hypothetical protein